MIDALRRRLPPPMLVPREKGFNLIRKAPDPDTLVLPGGGAKGVAYVGLLRVMKEDGAFAGVSHLVGSSAGSLAATLLAFSDDDRGLQTMLAGELPVLLDTREDLRPTYPGLSFHNTMSAAARVIWWAKGGKPLGEANGLVQKLDDITGTAAKRYLDSIPDDERASGIAAYARDRRLDPAAAATLQERVERLRQAPDFTRDRTGRMITFRDADLLHHLAPDRFRTVEVTAFAPATGGIHYFNADETPDVPLAYATRASLSHPLMATGVIIDGGPTLIDGGVRSNIPSEAAFDHDIARAIAEPANRDDEERHARTVVMRFGKHRPAAPAREPRHNLASRILSAIGSFVTSIPTRFVDWFMRRVSQNPHFEADRIADQQKFDGAGSNGFLLPHGKLRTIALDVAPEVQDEAINEAIEGLREQLEDRRNQAWFVNVDSVQDAFAMLTPAEKDSILQAGPPASPRDTAQADDDAARQAFTQAEADGEPADMRRATEALERAERLMHRAEADRRHLDARHRLAAELYAMVAADREAAPRTAAA